MSYNITNVKVYKINLKIKQANLRKLLMSNKDIEFSLDINQKFYINACEGPIRGILDKSGYYIFKTLEPWGEGSGNAWTEFIKPLLENCEGTYEARFVWKSGDSITKVSCVNGKIIETEVE